MSAQLTLGELLRAKRHACGLTLDEVSKITPIGKGYLCDIENGHHPNIGMIMLVNLADVYGINERVMFDAMRKTVYAQEPTGE